MSLSTSVCIRAARRFCLKLAAISSALIVISSPGSPAAVAATLVAPQQLTVTAANASGDSIYDLSLTTSSTSALISGIQTLNSDGGKHGSFDALVWSPNAFTGTLDLIVADATKGQILRYAGPNYGTSSVIFTYTKQGSGPADPAGLAVDGAGNLFVISPSSTLNATPALWVLPFNKATGAWGAPVLIDETCGGVKTLALADVLVAGTAATAEGSAAPAWHAGDVLVLVGDVFDPRVIVYSQAAVSGVLSKPGKPLAGPTSTVVGSKQFSSLAAAPVGMDIWPADATHGVSLLITTVDGRILRFDTAQNAFANNFASGLGLGLTKLKVGTYAGKPYAFVAQLGPGTSGQILQFGAPPASGANKALASVSKGVSEPIGLALVGAGSTPASACVAPSTCSPLGPQLTLQISGPGTSKIPAGATILQQACTVPTDPRVAVVNGVWSCLGPTINVCGATPTPGCVPATLDVANYCPGFPSTILPATMCGHAGASGAAFQVVKATAELLDENANDIYIETTADATVALPGPYDLICQKGMGQYGPLVAFAPRSDLPTIEGTIVEDANSPLFADFTGFCDTGGGNTHVESMFAFGLGLNAGANGLGTGPNAGLYGFVTTKFNNLSATLHDAAAQITPATVTTTLENYVTQSQTYFNNDYHNDVNDYSCALNSIASADLYLRNQATNPSVFSYTPPAAGNKNPNVPGEIDWRLANLYLSISGDFLYMPNPTWPTINVPPCVTLSITAATIPVAVGGSATLTFGPPTPQFASTPLLYSPTQCTLSASDGTYATPAKVGTSGSVSTGKLTKSGTYSATLECAGASTDTSSSFAIASVAVSSAPTLTAITVTPANPSVVAGVTQQFTATGTYSSGPSQTLSPVWSSGSTAIATISASSGVAQCLQAGSSTITATSGSISGHTTLTCTAAVLTSIAVTPASPSLTAGQTQQFTATGTYSSGPSQNLSSVTWSSTTQTVATITSGGLATCALEGSTTIKATSGAVSGSTTLTCNPGPLASLTLPSSESIPVGANYQYFPIGMDVDGNLVATGTVTYASTNLAVASVTSSGDATCLTAGSSTITAMSGNVTSNSSVLTCTLVTTYQYTGNTFPYNDAFGQYTSGDLVIASITVSVPLPKSATINLNTVVPAPVLTMSDGVQTLALQSSSGTNPVQVTTDNNGNISTWSLGLASAGDGITTQNLPPPTTNGINDIGFQGSDTLCVTETDCGIVTGSAGTWTSTNVNSLKVIVGSTSGTNGPTGQLYQVIVGNSAMGPTLDSSTILSETPEPATCFGAGGTTVSGIAAAVTSLAFVPNATTGFSDLVGANSSAGDVFRMSGPSYQPTTDINSASMNCWNTGPGGVAVAADAAGDVVGAGYDINNSSTPALYYFPPSPNGAKPNFVLMDNINADPSLTGSCNSSAFPTAGCVGVLVDAAVAQQTVSGTGVAAGDMLVLVGDAFSGINPGNPVVLRFPAAGIQTAKAYSNNCPNSFGSTSGAPPPCIGNSRGSPLVTQATLASVLSTGESPLAIDISPLDGSLFIATNGGNIYQVSPTPTGYGNAILYAYGQYGMQQMRVGQLNGVLYVFATVQNESSYIVMYQGAAPPGGFSYFSGVTSTYLIGAGAGLAVLSPSQAGTF